MILVLRGGAVITQLHRGTGLPLHRGAGMRQLWGACALAWCSHACALEITRPCMEWMIQHLSEELRTFCAAAAAPASQAAGRTILLEAAGSYTAAAAIIL